MSRIKKLVLEEFNNTDNLSFGKKYKSYIEEKNNFFKRLDNFKEMLKSLMSSNQLHFEYNEKKQILYFVGDVMKEYKSILKDYKKFDENYEPDITVFYITLEMDNFHRTHFWGIPKILKGINLGYYIYSYIGKKYNYISSDDDSTNEIKKMWNNLIKHKDFYSFYIKGKYDKYRLGIIYKPSLNNVKKDFLKWILTTSTHDIILDSKFAKDLYFDKEDFNLIKKRTGIFNLTLYGMVISEYNPNTEKWEDCISYQEGILTDIINRDVNKFLKDNNYFQDLLK